MKWLVLLLISLALVNSFPVKNVEDFELEPAKVNALHSHLNIQLIVNNLALVQD